MSIKPADVDDEGPLSVFQRYALKDNRYKKLIGGNFMWRMTADERAEFGRVMMRDAVDVSTADLFKLLAGDWRERLTGSWLAGFDVRYEVRDRISELLLSRQEHYAGKGYCFALARFGSMSDGLALLRYLQIYLRDLALRGDQPWALGALLLIDSQQSSELSSEVVEKDGIWDRWVAANQNSEPTPREMLEVVQGWCEFADDARREFYLANQ